MSETPAQRTVREKAEELRDKLKDGTEQFGDRLHEETDGVKTRIKEGITEALEQSRNREPLGHPPSRRPPSGRPPSVRRSSRPHRS